MQFQFPLPSESVDSKSSPGNFSLRNSVTFGSLPIFKSGRNGSSSAAPSGAMDPASSPDGSNDDERAGKRLKSNGPMDYLRSPEEGNGNPLEQAAQKQYLSPDADHHKSGGFAGQSEMVSDFERQMVAALGLSPTEPRPQQASTFEPRWSPGAATALESDGPRQQSKDNWKDDPSKRGTCAPVSERPSEKTLPILPNQPSTSAAASNMKDTSRPSMPVSEVVIPATKPVLEGGVKPPPPPKDRSPTDLPSKDVPPKDDLPGLPPKDVPPSKEDPPSPPPKDTPPQDIPSRNLVPPQSDKIPRQPSVSTLGAGEDSAGHLREGEIDNPPSPLQPPRKGSEDLPKHSVYNQHLPAQISDYYLPSIKDTAPGFGTDYAPRPPSSAEILESKRKSISGLPPSAPDVQSPLRNEVRYSPGTRSSMLSFGSFGRQSTNNSKGTRPNTPANEVSRRFASGSPSTNGDSKMAKLKNFGKRRRASVGNALSGLQEGLQGLQGRDSQGEAQKEGGQGKRAFSRISGFFGRRQEFQPVQSNAHDGYAGRTAPARTLPTPLSDGHTQTSFAQNGQPAIEVGRKDLPSTESAPPAPDSRRRASMPLSPSATDNSLMASRFYSSFQPAGEPALAQHGRTKSQPMLAPLPPSPIGGSESDKSGSWSSPPLSDVNDVEEWLSQKEQDNVQPPVPPKLPEPYPTPEQIPESSKEAQPAIQPEQVTYDPISYHVPGPLQMAREAPSQSQESNENHATFSVKPRKPLSAQAESTETTEMPIPKSISVSIASILSAHPHRSDARTVNETPEPVELAITHDDSSEEIIMSPTSYPGQEWTPTHYY
ncbi:uncharacterized protein N7482_009529 [Penicillium canariense]|uniref:Uncharacterized protein n=1 Tax=Penicillium canariense TaxID=189055 RepID=A0A9W9LEZ3_9EURO|nr:uncharacterized protein N7482_009529 [Penicillium canariense]KAJ5153051.1 hypothetical protein N7482_009529 [Penicillium canariense]